MGHIDVCHLVADVADEVGFGLICQLVVALVVVFGFYHELFFFKNLHTSIKGRLVCVKAL